MSREDFKERLRDTEDEKLDEILKNLESKGFIKLYRDSRKTIALAKATHEGLRRAAPKDSYKWYPESLSKNLIF